MQPCCGDVIADEAVCLVFSNARFLRRLSYSPLMTTVQTTDPMFLDFTALFGCQTVLLGACGLDVLARGGDAHRGSHLNGVMRGVRGMKGGELRGDKGVEESRDSPRL